MTALRELVDRLAVEDEVAGRRVDLSAGVVRDITGRVISSFIKYVWVIHGLIGSGAFPSSNVCALMTVVESIIIGSVYTNILSVGLSSPLNSG